MTNREKLAIAKLYGLDDATVAARAATAGGHAMTTKARVFLNDVREHPGVHRVYRHSTGQGVVIWESVWVFLKEQGRFKHKTCNGPIISEFEEVDYDEAIGIVARDFGVIHGLLTG